MKYKIYALLLVLLGMSTACSDQFLKDMNNYGDVDDSFYESETRVEWYVDNIYYDFYSGFKSPIATLIGDWDSDKTGMTEEIGGIKDLINPTLVYESSDDGSSYYGTKLESKIKNEPYNRIRDCNELIQNIDTKGSSLDEAFRNKAKGQMLYFRAIQYFDLMRVYGGVPIVTKLEEAESANPAIQLPRASVEELVAQITADLDAAASLLPSNWEASNYGRITKGAALAQKHRVLLTFASPLFNKDWDNTGNERWKKALDAGLAAEAELSSAGYGLYGSSAKDWAEMFAIDNAMCSEAIAVRLLGIGKSSSIENNSWENNIRLSSQNGGGGQVAPKEMIDLFPMEDGSRPSVDNGYDGFLFFQKRDPRFYRTFAFSGCRWGYKDNDASTVWAYKWTDGEKSYSSDDNDVASPAFVRKMTNTQASDFQYSGTDIFEYRYAELLLGIAECYAAKGESAKTTEYLGKIRNRVGIPSSNNYGIGNLADKYAALEACLYERRVELAYEGKRFWDIQRWMLYNDDAAANNNTCEKLGVAPINGTQRTGNYLKYKGTATADDPLAEARATISVDPDSETFQTDLETLATLYTNNFELEPLETPLDNVDSKPATIDWKQNYYIMGLHTSVLTQNTWLKQTKGWTDASGSAGNYDWQVK